MLGTQPSKSGLANLNFQYTNNILIAIPKKNCVSNQARRNLMVFLNKCNIPFNKLTKKNLNKIGQMKSLACLFICLLQTNVSKINIRTYACLYNLCIPLTQAESDCLFLSKFQAEGLASKLFLLAWFRWTLKHIYLFKT